MTFWSSLFLKVVFHHFLPHRIFYANNTPEDSEINKNSDYCQHYDFSGIAPTL